MNRLITALASASAIATVAACASNPQPPSAKAAGVERIQCDGTVAQQNDIALLSSVKVLEIEPIYSHVPTANNNTENRVNGAKLLIRPPKGISAEDLTRILQCHSARVLLGRVDGSALRDDPYWLPDTWVQIDVKPEDGNYAVMLSTDTIHDSLQVLGRANHYADDHMLAAEPPLP